MSLINDALKQARKAQPRNLPTPALPALQPVASEPSPAAVWLLPAIVIFLIVAAIFFIGWAVAHHTVRTTAAEPATGTDAQQEAAVTVPVVTPRPSEPPPPPPQDLPKLQGIFYSPTAPSAILDGKTVRPGNMFRQYKVKAISKYTVILTGPDKKDIQIGMSN